MASSSQAPVVCTVFVATTMSPELSDFPGVGGGEWGIKSSQLKTTTLNTKPIYL